MSSIIQKIFDELRWVRAPAANAVADKNPISKCAAYMWALIQANRVQKEFLDAYFKNHPTIAPVIILHVFHTQVTKVQFKRLEGRVSELEKKLKSQSTKDGKVKTDGDTPRGGNQNRMTNIDYLWIPSLSPP